LFDKIREDWRTFDRQLSRQGLWAITVYRFGHWQYLLPNRWVRLPFSAVYLIVKKLSEITTGIEIPCSAVIGRRFVIDHFGDIVLGGGVVFGDDCRIRNGVTVGRSHSRERTAPTIGNRVDIGAGAKILGAIQIGDDAVIGANAVVLKDVPANSVAVGVPARILPRRHRAAEAN
jgi:serine O-acetyltransferase